MIVNLIPIVIGLVCILIPIIKKWRGKDRAALIFMGVISVILGITKFGEW